MAGIAGDILDRMELERRANLYPNTSTKVREKRATLKFSTEELLHDIANMAYVEGDLIDGGNEHAAHQVRDICEDGNRERVLRVVDMAIAKCRERLYPYTREDAQDGTELDNAPDEKEQHVISLLLPEDFSKTTLDYLNKKEGIAIVTVTHDIRSALRYATHILHAGHGTYFFGTAAEYLTSPWGKRFGGDGV